MMDRDRLRAYSHFLWQRFLDDRCLQTAGALAYTTLFALVPVTAAVLGILSAFPVFQTWRAGITDFVFDNFVPSAGKVVQTYLTEFADNASQATAIGVLVLLFSAISLMMSIEDAFNRIWRVQTARTAGSRFLMYWTALSFGPLLLVAALGISSYLFALPLVSQVDTDYGLKTRLLGVLPFVIVWIALLASYRIVPNRTVPLRNAAVGSLIGAVLFEIAKRGFAWYVGSLASYAQVYGAVAVFPIFLVWIYVSWAIVLLGASLTAAGSAFEYRPAEARLPEGHEFFGLLGVLRHFVAAQRAGRGLHSTDLTHCERYVTDDLLQRYLGDLNRAGLIQRNEQGEWVMVRDLASVTLLDVYETGRYRLPLDCPADAGYVPPAFAAIMQEACGPLRERMLTPLSVIYSARPRSDTDDAPAAVCPEPK